MTAALLALCACGAAVSAVLPAEASASPSAAAVETPAPEPTEAPTPAPPVTPAPTEEPAASPEPAPVPPLPPGEELQRTLSDSDAYCAALYLGRSGAPLADALPELLVQKGLDGVSYLADISASDCVEHAGDEVFILIPRGDRVLSLYNYVLETNDNYDAYPGALLYSSAGRCAVAVRCNESDVRPNVLAVFSGLDGDRSFSPRITLENEALLPAPGVYALTSRLHFFSSKTGLTPFSTEQGRFLFQFITVEP